MSEPALLLCDEPTGNLDSENTESVLNLFGRLTTTPPRSPIVVDSTRNWPATWRREAPRARRRPISPMRSMTVTRVTLAIPMAPTSSETRPRTRNSPLTSPCTPLRALAGSAGAVTVREASAPGASAIGAWRATLVVVVAVAAVREWTPVLDVRLALGAPVAGALVGLLAGLYPSLRASRMEPVDALRS